MIEPIAQSMAMKTQDFLSIKWSKWTLKWNVVFQHPGELDVEAFSDEDKCSEPLTADGDACELIMSLTSNALPMPI